MDWPMDKKHGPVGWLSCTLVLEQVLARLPKKRRLETQWKTHRDPYVKNRVKIIYKHEFNNS